jgi:hypothetical protein
MITAALIATLGVAALTTPASAAPLSPAPAVGITGVHDGLVDVRWHPIRRMRHMMHRRGHHRM